MQPPDIHRHALQQQRGALAGRFVAPRFQLL